MAAAEQTLERVEEGKTEAEEGGEEEEEEEEPSPEQMTAMVVRAMGMMVAAGHVVPPFLVRNFHSAGKPPLRLLRSLGATGRSNLYAWARDWERGAGTTTVVLLPAEPPDATSALLLSTAAPPQTQRPRVEHTDSDDDGEGAEICGCRFM